MRLICFGDSWTAGHGVETNKIYKEEPFPNMFTQKLREQNSWPRYVANELNCLYVNLVKSEYSTTKKFKSFLPTILGERDKVWLDLLIRPLYYLEIILCKLGIFKNIFEEIKTLNLDELSDEYTEGEFMGDEDSIWQPPPAEGYPAVDTETLNSLKGFDPQNPDPGLSM